MVDKRSRRLPSWMVATTAASGGNNHSNNDSHHTDVAQGDQKEKQKPATRRTSKSKKQTQDAITIDNPKVTANGSGEKKGRKPRKEYTSSVQEFDLTVEDLLSIAQQYVTEDEEARETQSDSEIPATSNLETSNNATSQDTSTTVPTIVTGDAVQDMLELFLGPLPKKPVEHQSVTKDVDFDRYLNSLCQPNAGDGTMPPAQMKMKKKSSLKDKVASLLH